MYLALTGRAIGRADAYRLGLVTHCIPAPRFGEIRAALARRRSRRSGARRPPRGPGPRRARAAAAPHRALLLRPTRSRSIIERLQAERGRRCGRGREAVAEGPREALADLAQDHASPRARGARRSICAPPCIAGLPPGLPLPRGPRLLRGRARRPHRPRPGAEVAAGRLEDVSEAMVDGYFAPLGPASSTCRSRAEMQAVGLRPETPALGSARPSLTALALS